MACDMTRIEQLHTIPELMRATYSSDYKVYDEEAEHSNVSGDGDDESQQHERQRRDDSLPFRANLARQRIAFVLRLEFNKPEIQIKSSFYLQQSISKSKEAHDAEERYRIYSRQYPDVALHKPLLAERHVNNQTTDSQNERSPSKSK